MHATPARHTSHRPRCGVLLAGGHSSRFVSGPKGLAPFGSGRLADVALDALRRSCDRVVIAANDPAAAAWFPDATIVRDTEPAQGGLNALGTALRAAHDGIVVVCAWDMPFVSADILRTLAGVVDAGAPACVPQHSTGAWEPLCAAYDHTCAPVALDLLRQGQRAAQALPEACHAIAWPITGASSAWFFNVNTADDLVRAERVRAAQATVAS